MSPEDFTPASGDLTFSPGQSLTQQVTVRVVGDTLDESDETFSLALSSPSGATLDPQRSSATETITDDDTPPPPGSTKPRADQPPVVANPEGLNATGKARVGDPLTLASPGVWKPGAHFFYRYQWLRCDRQGGGCQAITNSTADPKTPTSGDGVDALYTVSDDDIDHTIRIRITAKNDAGEEGRADSDPSAIVPWPTRVQSILRDGDSIRTLAFYGTVDSDTKDPNVSVRVESASNSGYVCTATIPRGRKGGAFSQTTHAWQATIEDFGRPCVDARTRLVARDGDYVVSVSQLEDNGGRRESRRVAFHLDKSPPRPKITSPRRDGHVFRTSGPLKFRGTGGRAPGDESDIDLRFNDAGHFGGLFAQETKLDEPNKTTWHATSVGGFDDGIYGITADQFDNAYVPFAGQRHIPATRIFLVVTKTPAQAACDRQAGNTLRNVLIDTSLLGIRDKGPVLDAYAAHPGDYVAIWSIVKTLRAQGASVARRQASEDSRRHAQPCAQARAEVGRGRVPAEAHPRRAQGAQALAEERLPAHAPVQAQARQGEEQDDAHHAHRRAQCRCQRRRGWGVLVRFEHPDAAAPAARGRSRADPDAHAGGSHRLQRGVWMQRHAAQGSTARAHPAPVAGGLLRGPRLLLRAEDERERLRRPAGAVRRVPRQVRTWGVTCKPFFRT